MALRKIAVNTFKAAACIALIVTIAAPIAIANVESLRSSVLRLLITQDEEQGAANFDMVSFPDTNAFSHLPEDWIGDYFPTLIPDGFEVYERSEFSASITFINAEGKTLNFEEQMPSTSSSRDNENADTWYTEVNGWNAYVISKNECITIVWAIEDRFFEIAVEPSTYEETLRIAESVQRIVRQPGETRKIDAPADWKGEYYITELPVGLMQSFVSPRVAHAEFSGNSMRKVVFTEYPSDEKIKVDAEGAETWYADVNGRQAYIVSKNGFYTIIWQTEDKLFKLEVRKSNYDEAIRIARSVRKISSR